MLPVAVKAIDAATSYVASSAHAAANVLTNMRAK